MKRKTRTEIETDATIRSGGKARQICVEFDPDNPALLNFRLKGTRTRYPTQVTTLFVQSVAAHTAAQKAARKARRR